MPVDHLPETAQKWVNNRSDSQITMVMALHYFENEAANFVCYAADALIVAKLLNFTENLFFTRICGYTIVTLAIPNSQIGQTITKLNNKGVQVNLV